MDETIRVIAQVVFRASLMSDGKLLLNESGSYHLNPGQPQRYTEWHDVEGTCDPEELADVLAKECQSWV